MQNQLLTGETRVQGFNLPVRLIDAIKDLAAKEHRSASAQVRLVLSEYVEKSTQKGGETGDDAK
jgi:hypothetical protein